MPISEKIISEIDKLDTDAEIKKLMMDILYLEDNGAKRWNKQYDEILKQYLGGDKEE